MNYLVIGLNHKTSPVAVREKIALDEKAYPHILKKFKKNLALQEVVVVSTCNRVEVYCFCEDNEKNRNYIISLLTRNQIPENHIYIKTGCAAIKHLFSVVSSVDSQIIGENQISKQLLVAYHCARDIGTTGPSLNKLFEQSFNVAKKVKTQTALSRGNISVGSVAIALTQKIFGALDQVSVLLLGAGEIATLTLKSLKARGAKTSIINRTFENAKKLENKNLGKALAWTRLEEQLLETDVLISSLSCFLPLLSQDLLQKTMNIRKNKPLFIVDLGVPRNIDAAVNSIDNLYLYNMDDLSLIAKENQKKRAKSMLLAKNIIDEEACLFYDAIPHHEVRPMIKKIGEKAEQLRQLELAKTREKLLHLSEADFSVVEQLSHSLVNKLLLSPVLKLKKQKEPLSEQTEAIVKQLFEINSADTKGDSHG